MRMKLKKSLIFITFLLIYNIMFSMVEGPGGESGAWMYFRAFASVKDVNGQPLQGIQIRMVASYGLYEEDFETGFPEWRIYTFSKIGYTDANGNVLLEGFVNVTAYYPGKYKFYDLEVLMESPNYAIVSHSGDYSQLSHTSAYFTIGEDYNKNNVPDIWEQQLAKKFSPVIHKHPDDLQEDLSDPDWVLSYSNSKLQVYNLIGQELFDKHVSNWHLWHGYQWDTFAKDPYNNQLRLNIPGEIKHKGAPVGERPLFFHVYKEGEYFYLQYWYFFNCNDIQHQTKNGIYHDGDFEHISIKIERSDNSFIPLLINFYQHDGGHTKLPEECFWSSTNSTNWEFKQGYDDNHTHLHIWIAKNSHASYSFDDLMYKFSLTLMDVEVENYIDDCDYIYNNNEKYFMYDKLLNLGEVMPLASKRCPVTGYKFIDHYITYGESQWICFVGMFGSDFKYIITDGIPFLDGASQYPPQSPFFGTKHEWKKFTVNLSVEGFGNQPKAGKVEWVKDPSNND